MLKVLMAASEGVPFSKTGGLADVVGSLPKALADREVDVRVILPLYGSIKQNLRDQMAYKKYIYVKVGWRNQYCGIFECRFNGILYYFVDNEYYFKRDGLYGDYDDAERYAFFDRAVLDVLPQIDFCPDIIHCHDWQTGMVPVLLEAQYRQHDFYKGIKTLFTIHNLKYQGIFPKSVLDELLGLGDEYFASDKLEFYDNMSFMKGGLTYSMFLNTVSPTYAEEIRDPYFGENLDGLLKARKHQLAGILNGINYHEFDPRNDTYLNHPYGTESIGDKVKNKLELQEQLGIEVNAEIPVIGMISRLTSQKGLDLVACVLDDLMASGIELVVLGTGETQYENLFREASFKYTGRISASIKFDNALAHLIYAGADMFLMPSLFEPCGLGQIIALKYGTLPIVRETGGLRDTVRSFDESTMEGNGFSFTNYNAHDMLYTVRRALGFYRNKTVWDRIVKNAMDCDFSWDVSALKYIEIYEHLIEK